VGSGTSLDPMAPHQKAVALNAAQLYG